MEGLKKQRRFIGCSEIAAAVGRHPNTIRLYETWGFISPVPRRANGYRAYTEAHLLQAKVAVIALRSCFQDWRGRRLMLALIKANAGSEFEEAVRILGEHRKELGHQQALVRDAARALANWGKRADPEGEVLGRWRAAQLLGFSPDTLRDWERNGLVDPDRSPSGRRIYTDEDLDRIRVIQVLRKAGHSLMGIRRLLVGDTALEDLSFARDRWEESLDALVADAEELAVLILEEAGRGVLEAGSP